MTCILQQQSLALCVGDGVPVHLGRLPPQGDTDQEEGEDENAGGHDRVQTYTERERKMDFNTDFKHRKNIYQI